MFKSVTLIRYSTDWNTSLFHKIIKWRSKSRKETGLGPWALSSFALVLPWASWTEHSIFAGLKLFIFRIKACFRILIRKVCEFSARDHKDSVTKFTDSTLTVSHQPQTPGLSPPGPWAEDIISRYSHSWGSVGDWFQDPHGHQNLWIKWCSMCISPLHILPDILNHL